MFLFSNIVVLKSKPVTAELTVIPLRNETTNQTDSESCHLRMNNSMNDDIISLSGDPFQSCVVQVTASNRTAALLQIPQYVNVYATLLGCQKKYVYFKTDSHDCFSVVQDHKMHIFLQVSDRNDSTISISHTLFNKFVPLCSENAVIEEQRVYPSRLNQTKYCQTVTYDHMVSCTLSPDYSCSFKFKSNCYATLGRQDVQFHCHNGNVNLTHKVLIIYPIKTITLNLSKQNIIEIHDNSFSSLRHLQRLYLEYNQLSHLGSDVFQGLTKLNILSLWGNKIKSLPVGIFQSMTNLTQLLLRENRLSVLHKDMFRGLHNLSKLYLDKNKLTDIPEGLFSGLTNLNILRLGENKLISLHVNTFRETNTLTDLNIKYTDLKYLPNQLFRGLQDLKVLKLFRNRLQTLPYDMFWGLINLETLSLDSNNISYLDSRIFNGLENLRVLYLHNNQLKVLHFHLFQQTTNLTFLDLSTNYLTDIPNIRNLNHLKFLNLMENQMTDIAKRTLYKLPRKTELVVSQHEICECYAPTDINCTAASDRSPYLTCDRLLSDRILVITTWLIGLNALFGNMYVLCLRNKRHDRNSVQRVLLSNLAMSDLLMGVYMLFIASADIYFGDYFPMQAETWRSGITCRIAGTISILSSEASVFFVTLISIDRFICIRYPYTSRKFGKKSVTVTVSLLWIISLALGIIPSSLAGRNDDFYDNSHVCIGLPLSKLHKYKTYHFDWILVCTDDDICYWKEPVKSKFLGEVNGMIFASVMFLGLNLLCYLIILVCYIEIVRSFLKTSKRTGRNPDEKEQIRLTLKVAAIVLTDFVCWFPIILLGILVQAGVLTLPASVFACCVTFILPINSAINPYLYTIGGVVSNRLKGQHSSAEYCRTRDTLDTEMRVQEYQNASTRSIRDA